MCVTLNLRSTEKQSVYVTLNDLKCSKVRERRVCADLEFSTSTRHVIREREEVHVLPTVGSQSRLVAREMRGSIENGCLNSGERGTPVPRRVLTM